jgi:hypothetical protein
LFGAAENPPSRAIAATVGDSLYAMLRGDAAVRSAEQIDVVE